MHEGRRAILVGKQVRYRAVVWGDYLLNYMNRKFTVTKGGQTRCVWDVFAFFQSKFTKALEDWNKKAWEKGQPGFATKLEIEFIEKMKDQRSELEKLSREEVHAYCQAECKKLAKLGRALLQAHEDAGFRLKRYHGAGSSASALLDKMGVRELRGEQPERMREPLACAFFGGRFENRVIGPIAGPVFNYDISSAYPYQSTFLPCLLCGGWTHLQGSRRTDFDRAIRAADLALIQWQCLKSDADAPWGPLPVRKADGTIAFPLAALGGWTWKDEFLAARKLNPHVEALQVWTYTTDCEHRPFALLPSVYIERVRIGKEGAGIVFKLAPNSVYGKVAQSLGINPPYQSIVWAGNITSGCRAQLLDAICASERRESILMLATDGVWSLESLSLPRPRDTGTDETGIPLGGWERKEFPRGVFAVRPGIYFPLEPTEADLEKVRARGLGRKVLYQQWHKIVDAWHKRKTGIEFEGITRFIGAKSGVTWSPKQGVKRSKDYGEWVNHPVKVTFDPKPKREFIDGQSLTPWKRFDAPSMAYSKFAQSPEAQMLALATLIAEEQPNADFSDMDLEAA
jgi:hypothetical protein